MQPEQIGQAYDQITHLWQADSFDRRNGIAQHQRALAFSGNRGTALDVGCGCTGRIIDLLLDAGFTAEGVDISAKMIALARQRQPQLTFHQQDICKWGIDTKYDFISAWDSIWHVPLTQQAAVLRKLIACLNPGGVLIFSFGGTVEPDEHRNNAMGPELYYSTLGVNGIIELVLSSGASVKHLEFDQHPELHAYCIIQQLNTTE